jgi:hypothetical protein
MYNFGLDEFSVQDKLFINLLAVECKRKAVTTFLAKALEEAAE